MAPAPSPSENQKANGPSPLKLSPSKAQKAQPLKAKPVSPPAVKPVSKPQQKTLSSRSGKPIINWLHRKLVGSGRLSKRMDSHRPGPDSIVLGKGRAGPTSLTSRTIPRIASSPVPSPSYSGSGKHDRHDSFKSTSQRRTISLNGDDEYPTEDVDDNSFVESSLARESTWSPASGLEADDDASLRPIPPSAPPSPSPSRSSSSYLSDPRTFRSMAASTKPTTLLSIDLGNGMAHIAQAPATPSYTNRFPPHLRNQSNGGMHGSGTSITFSSLPQSSSRPSSMSNSGTHLAMPQGYPPLQVPLHTAHHPRNNPRPSSPPLDNASMLTLASSAYAIPGMRANLGHSTTASARGIGDSMSHFGGSITYGDVESTSQFVLGDDDRLDERDVDASVRALRPRSSRRGSWESEASRWSARVQSGTGTPSLARERSLRTSNSIKTGVLSPDNTETYDLCEDIACQDDQDPSPVSGMSVEAPSSTRESDPTGHLLSRASADISDRKVSSDTVEPPVITPTHKEHTQIVRFTSDTQAGMDEKDNIPHGLNADTA